MLFQERYTEEFINHHNRRFSATSKFPRCRRYRNLFSRRTLLYTLVLTFLTLYVLIGLSSDYEPYVLPPGFPLVRWSPSSAVYQSNPGSGFATSLKLSYSVPWAMTQRWTAVGEATPDSAQPMRYTQCSHLLTDNASAQKNAHDFMAKHTPVTRSEWDYIWETLDCPRFVRERGYILDSSDREKEFPIAFSLIFYKDLEQVERLLRAIYRPHNFYCLHLDTKSSPTMQAAIKVLASCLDNVFVSSSSVDVQWGTFSVLGPELICMKDLWHHKSWRYFINLTGQEFPLKTNLQLVNILRSLNGSNDVDCTRNQRTMNRWYNNFGAPHAIHPRKGNLHITASRGFVDYMLHSRVARDFLAWVNLTEVPDETFFSTLNHNPHLSVPGATLGIPPDTDPVIKPYLSRFKNWGNNWRDKDQRALFKWPCYGKRVRTICVFGVGDLPMLTSRKELFANKFHADFEPLTIDCMEEWLWNMTMDEYSGRARFGLSYYQHLHSAKHHIVNREYG